MDSTTTNLKNVSYLLAIFLIFLGSIFAYLPLNPSFPDLGLDQGWMFALNAAREHGFVFGRDIVFTFGPYDAVYTKLYGPATGTEMLWGSAILALSYFAAVICLFRNTSIVTGIVLTILLMVLVRDTQLFVIPFIFFILVWRVSQNTTTMERIHLTGGVALSLTLLVIALSLLVLVKGSFLMASFAALGFACLLLLIRGHVAMATVIPLLFVASTIGLWIAASQPIGALPGFFQSELPIISGYTNAMSTIGRIWEPIGFVACCLILGFLCLPVIRTQGTVGWIFASGMAVILFLAFKAGFVRHDGHALTSAGVLVVTALLLTSGFSFVRGLVIVAVGFFGWYAIDQSYTSRKIGDTIAQVRQQYITAAKNLVIITDNNYRRRQYEDSLQFIRSQSSLPKLSGTTDIYSFGQSSLLANGLNWSPRPVIQSYSAYLPTLEARNLGHISGPNAPENILFAVEPIDNRLPALEDGLSWPYLLKGYRPVAMVDGRVLLRHSDGATVRDPTSNVPLVSRSAALGEQIVLPSVTGALWARVVVTPTLLGGLASFLFKQPQLWITYRFSDGHEQAFRFIAGMGQAGFVASPVVTDTRGFLALELPGSAAATSLPVSFRISGDSGTRWLWNRDFEVEFSDLAIPYNSDVPQLLSAKTSLLSQAQTVPTNAPVTKYCSFDLIDGKKPVDFPVRLSGSVHVEGWVAVSIEKGIAGDQPAITLRASDGRTRFIDAQRSPRPDVNEYFHKREMGKLGFTTSVDISSLFGPYTLSLMLHDGNTLWDCAAKLPVFIDSPKQADAASP